MAVAQRRKRFNAENYSVFLQKNAAHQNRSGMFAGAPTAPVWIESRISKRDLLAIALFNRVQFMQLDTTRSSIYCPETAAGREIAEKAFRLRYSVAEKCVLRAGIQTEIAVVDP